MRASYPVIDALGHLKEFTSGQYWLVLPRFHRSPQNSQLPRNISMFTYFNKSCGENGSSKILLLYVSPKEEVSTLLMLLSDIQKQRLRSMLNNKICYGVLSKESSFHKSTSATSYFTEYYT